MPSIQTSVDKGISFDKKLKPPWAINKAFSIKKMKNKFKESDGKLKVL